MGHEVRRVPTDQRRAHHRRARPTGSKAAPIRAAKAWLWGIDGALPLSRSPCAVPASSGCGRRCCWRGAVTTSRSIERSPMPFAQACSLYAGAMLAPRCEEESAEPADRRAWQTRPRAVARDLSRHGGERHARRGAAPRPRRARPLRAHDRRAIGGCRRQSLPRPSRRSPTASPARCFIPRKHISRRTPALRFLLDAVIAEGVTLRLGDGEAPRDADLVIDCRGLAAKDDLPNSARRARRTDRHQEPRGAIWRGPCGCCIRAFRFTSSPGAKAFT